MQPCGRCGKDRRKSGGSAARPDFVFFDLPGTINNADVVQTISQMDYIFTPIIADRVVMESSIVRHRYQRTDDKHGQVRHQRIYLVEHGGRARKDELYQAYDKVCAEFALSILETHLPDSKRFRKETAERKAVFRSTAFPADKILVRGSNLDKLVSMRFSASSKLNGMAEKQVGDIDSEAVINSVSTGRYKHSAGSEAGRKRYFSTSERSDTGKPFLHLPRTPKRSRTQAQEQQAGKNWIMTPYSCGSNITARLGKQVYIRKEYHDRIQKMLHVIGGNEVTIAAFLDNVLTHHFTLFQDEIAESFKTAHGIL